MLDDRSLLNFACWRWRTAPPLLDIHFLRFYVFVLAGFVGYQIITKVPALLHTPLMSATNAISRHFAGRLAGGRRRQFSDVQHRVWASSRSPPPRSTSWAGS